jgi:serine/threonine protein phosphatase PrpC
MLVNSLKFTTKGTRICQLDRIGYYQGGNWSVAYILDGLVESTPHFVDCVDNNLKSLFNALAPYASLQSLEDLAIEAISNNVVSEGKASIALLIYTDNQVSILTAGDTRVYFLNERTRTIDHSIAQELVSSGKLNEAFLNQNAFRKYLTKCIYKDMDKCELEKSTYNEISEDSRFIICSDGFWSDFDNDEDIYSLTVETLDSYLASLSDETLLDNTSAMLLEKE